MVYLENFNFIKNYYCKIQQRWGFFKNYIPLKMILFILFSIKLISISYINDDILLTIRTVLNFINGHGPVFNLGERVQAYTHPLWFFILSGVIYITQEIFYTLIFTNAFFSVLSIYIIIKAYDFHKLSFKLFFLFLFLLSLSACFVDYTSSGLENGLGFFLFSLLLYCTNKNKWTFIPIISGLLFLTRMDYTLIYLPFLIYYTFCKKDLFKNKLFSLSCFFIITFGWLFFSLVYYGSFFPNTYFAKTLIDAHWSFSLVNAKNYYKVFFDKDIYSFLYIFTYLCYCIYNLCTLRIQSRYTANKQNIIQQKNFQVINILISFSIGLYLLYIVWIGGDFMMGRFLSIPVFLGFPSLFKIMSKKFKVYYRKIENTEMSLDKYFSFILVVMCLFFASLVFNTDRLISPFFRFYKSVAGASKQVHMSARDFMTKSEISDEKFHYFKYRNLSNSCSEIRSIINRAVFLYDFNSMQYIHSITSNVQNKKIREGEGFKNSSRKWENLFCKKQSRICSTWDLHDFKFIKSLHKKMFHLDKVSFFGFYHIGWFSLTKGSNHFIIDPYALTDPLLSRIQYVKLAFLERPGHFEKHIPKGYVESIKTESNQICNTKVKKLYNDVRLLTRSKDLWDWDRLKLALKMSFQRKPVLYEDCI